MYAKYDWAMESQVTLYCCKQLYIDRSINLTHNIRRGTKTICILNFNHAMAMSPMFFAPRSCGTACQQTEASFPSRQWRPDECSVDAKGDPSKVGWTWFHRFSPLESPYVLGEDGPVDMSFFPRFRQTCF